MFSALGKALEPYIDKVVVVLLQKSADTNKFIRYVDHLLSNTVLNKKSIRRICRQ